MGRALMRPPPANSQTLDTWTGLRRGHVFWWGGQSPPPDSELDVQQMNLKFNSSIAHRSTLTRPGGSATQNKQTCDSELGGYLHKEIIINGIHLNYRAAEDPECPQGAAATRLGRFSTCLLKETAPLGCSGRDETKIYSTSL